MASALRVRVIWDDTIIEDTVYTARRIRIRIGAGERAQVAAPGREDRYATIERQGETFVLRIEPGAACAVERPGEEPVDLTGHEGDYVLRLAPPFGAGRLVIGDAVIELERVERPGPARDRALAAWAAAALVLGLLAGGSYRLVRLLGDGDQAKWGRPAPLSARDATRVRVRIGPDGEGASRPQAGRGVALHGESSARARTPSAAQARAERTPPPLGRPKRAAGTTRGVGPRPGTPAGVAAQTPKVLTPEPSRDVLIGDAQAALLAAELRQAIDNFSRAAKTSPLDYDELNWLGLAHYLSGEYDDAERVWREAEAADPRRADAINNLASVAKRRGDTARELERLKAALAVAPSDCHASNSLALAQAKAGRVREALETLEQSDAHCGGNYAYTSIQRAAIFALDGKTGDALAELEKGLKAVDTLIPVKEFEVLADLKLDPAFAPLRAHARFGALIARYLPRAAAWDKDL